MLTSLVGAMPEWLGSGLQNHLHRFKSGWHLQTPPTPLMKFQAKAYPNIALIKYWGKLDEARNLPATGSLSLTLDIGETTTTLIPSSAALDTLTINDVQISGEPLRRTQAFMDTLRQLSGSPQHFEIISKNDFPTASGLASSASGLAALTLAANAALDLNLSNEKLAEFAQLGSASAARSLLPGWVKMNSGADQTAGSPIIEPIETPIDDIRIIVLQTTDAQKSVGSREGMRRSKSTSPYYSEWINSHPADLSQAIEALQKSNFERLGQLMEHSTLKMHATTMTAHPGFWYFKPITLELMEEVQSLRKKNLSCFFTMDAGPHVKVLCKHSDEDAIKTHFQTHPNIHAIRIAKPGPAAQIIPSTEGAQ